MFLWIESSCLKTRIANTLSDFLHQGITPEKLAFSIAIGIGIGIFPLFGLATLFCTLAAIVCRLNLRPVQIANYVAFPLQILLFSPQVRLGEKMFATKPFPLYPPQVVDMLHRDMFRTLNGLGHAAGHALAAWMLIAPVSVAVIYFSVAPYLLSLATKSERVPVKAKAAAAAAR
jgi:uncharacterized protein (DUF2062 family)